MEDEGHLMECPLYFNPRITLGLNARFDMTDEQMKEVFTPSCREGWRALAAFLRECKRVRRAGMSALFIAGLVSSAAPGNRACTPHTSGRLAAGQSRD